MVLAIIAAAVAGLVLSGAYYAVVPIPEPVAADGQAGPAAVSAATQAIVELCRSAAVAGLVAGLVGIAGWSSVGQGVLLGLALWTLPVVLLAGSVVHEGTAVRTAAVHAGDWLLKLPVIGAVIAALT